MINKNLSVNHDGVLLFAGQDTVALLKEYGSPLYLMDEDLIRERCRAYRSAMQKHFDERACPFYASKAASFKEIYRIMKEEEMGVDVVSMG